MAFVFTFLLNLVVLLDGPGSCSISASLLSSGRPNEPGRSFSTSASGSCSSSAISGIILARWAAKRREERKGVLPELDERRRRLLDGVLGVAVALAAGDNESTSLEWRISDWDLVLGGELLSKGDEPLECFNVFLPMLAVGVILEDADTDLRPRLGVAEERGDFCPARVSDSALLLHLDA